MNETTQRIKSHETRDEKLAKKDRRSTSGKRRASASDLTEPGGKQKSKVSNSRGKIVSTENETYRTFQALLLALSVLVLSYHGLRYGRTEYSVLENGQIVNGYVSARRAVITFSLGYSVFYSFFSSLSISMLLYSLVSVMCYMLPERQRNLLSVILHRSKFYESKKKPRWSLPTILIYMADLVCHVADSLVAFWLFFGHLKFSTALFYTVITSLVISGELWIWLGVLRLYEHRTFK